MTNGTNSWVLLPTQLQNQASQEQDKSRLDQNTNCDQIVKSCPQAANAVLNTNRVTEIKSKQEQVREAFKNYLADFFR